MPTIMLKKTFKIKPSGFKIAHEKSFSFHGSAVSPDLINGMNQALASSVRYTNGANRMQFAMDRSGHFFGAMNHECQKHHEEDVICCILDTMEVLGWSFKFQYDSESSSQKMSGASFTSKELFIFQK
jgi:hypothetical protein